MALSVKLVSPDNTRSALHDGVKNDSARDKVVRFFHGSHWQGNMDKDFCKLHPWCYLTSNLERNIGP
jgi:hypothetical protein